MGLKKFVIKRSKSSNRAKKSKTKTESTNVRSRSTGRGHLGSTFGICQNIDQETISRHDLIEKDIKLLGVRKAKLVNEASEYESESEHRPVETDQLHDKVKELCSKYDELIELAHGQRETLNGKLLSHNLQNDLKEMDHWIHTKLDLLER